MANDPLAAFRTGPAPQGSEPERHRSVADGELHTAWSLKDFFGSLNTVMRLPTKARRAEKAKEGKSEGFSIALPGIPGWMGRFVMVGGGMVAVTVFVLLPVMRWATGAGHASLKPVVGVWEAGKGKYQGRRFEMTDSAVVFRTGKGATDYTWHRVQEVRVKQVADSTLYTVRYEEGQKTADMTFWYVGTDKIRLKNTPNVVWNKTTLVPSAGPPPPPPPRIGKNS